MDDNLAVAPDLQERGDGSLVPAAVHRDVVDEALIVAPEEEHLVAPGLSDRLGDVQRLEEDVAFDRASPADTGGGYRTPRTDGDNNYFSRFYDASQRRTASHPHGHDGRAEVQPVTSPLRVAIGSDGPDAPWPGSARTWTESSRGAWNRGPVTDLALLEGLGPRLVTGGTALPRPAGRGPLCCWRSWTARSRRSRPNNPLPDTAVVHLSGAADVSSSTRCQQGTPGAGIRSRPSREADLPPERLHAVALQGRPKPSTGGVSSPSVGTPQPSSPPTAGRRITRPPFWPLTA